MDLRFEAQFQCILILEIYWEVITEFKANSVLDIQCNPTPVSIPVESLQVKFGDNDELILNLFVNLSFIYCENITISSFFAIWTTEMMEKLIICIKGYKASMELQGLDFDGDWSAQYKEIRKKWHPFILTTRICLGL